MPYRYVFDLASALNGDYDSKMSTWVVDCHQKFGSVTFNFAKGAKITIPLSDLVFKVSPKKTYDNKYCALGILADDERSRLGVNFLKHAYVHFDLEEKVVGMAPIIFTKKTSVEALKPLKK